MTRHSGVYIGSMLLILALLMVSCGQATAPPSQPTEAPPAATTEPAGDEEDEEVSDDQIREPVGHVETFWNSFDWADLTTAEQEAWGILGWEEESWDEEINIPASEEANWDELTAEEQEAASKLGYDQQTWDES